MPLLRNLRTPASRAYWEFVEETAQEVRSNYLYHRGCPREGPCSLGDGTERCWQVVQKAISVIQPDELLVEAWERMTFGGVVAREDDLVPNNTLTNVGGQWVSHPIQRSFDAGYFARRGDV